MTQQFCPERRMSQRIPMAVGMHIYAYGMLVASGATIDMSEHGLLMRIDQDYSDDQLEPGKHLDIVLEDAPPEQWMPVLVVRNDDSGIAACFLAAHAQVGFM